VLREQTERISLIGQRLRFLRELGCESTLQGLGLRIARFQGQRTIKIFPSGVWLIVAQIQP
jgi:hypothetical protein